MPERGKTCQLLPSSTRVSDIFDSEIVKVVVEDSSPLLRERWNTIVLLFPQSRPILPEPRVDKSVFKRSSERTHPRNLPGVKPPPQLAEPFDPRLSCHQPEDHTLADLNCQYWRWGIKGCSLDTLGLRPCVWRQSYKSSKICALRKHHRNKRNPVNQENPSYASGDGEPETSPEGVAQGEKHVSDRCRWHSCIGPFLGVVISDSDEPRSLPVHQALGPVSNDLSTIPRRSRNPALLVLAQPISDTQKLPGTPGEEKPSRSKAEKPRNVEVDTSRTILSIASPEKCCERVDGNRGRDTVNNQFIPAEPEEEKERRPDQENRQVEQDADSRVDYVEDCGFPGRLGYISADDPTKNILTRARHRHSPSFL